MNAEGQTTVLAFYFFSQRIVFLRGVSDEVINIDYITVINIFYLFIYSKRQGTSIRKFFPWRLFTSKRTCSERYNDYQQNQRFFDNDNDDGSGDGVDDGDGDGGE